ncbi:MAG: hypothetical protein H6732_16975 [Alphaproteobacteria bacterium]|nr:hypothetical protein [Alphaproteobacteria bacterium]
MSHVTSRALCLALLGSLGGCDTDHAPEGDGAFVVRVAPLTLTGVTDAVYRLTVVNEAGDTVWSKKLSSTQYGDGAGAIAYVGPCDASDTDGDGRALNTVELELLDLVGPDPGSWTNPTAAGPVVLAAVCTPQADTEVRFDLTILRQGEEGFFDVAVRFDDIFCSAKVDCVGADGGPLRLLFDDQGTRLPTAVMALACSAGPGEDLRMQADDLTISCATGEAYRLDMTPASQGRLAAPPLVLRYQVTAGSGMLPEVDQLYWTMAAGLDEALLTTPDKGHGDCRLKGRATASKGPLPTTATTWPYIQVDVPLTAADGSLACTTHTLSAGKEVVATYDEPELLGHELTHTVQQSP